MSRPGRAASLWNEKGRSLCLLPKQDSQVEFEIWDVGLQAVTKGLLSLGEKNGDLSVGGWMTVTRPQKCGRNCLDLGVLRHLL